MNRLPKISIAFLLIVISCQPSDTYTDLSDNAKEFLEFDVGNSFQLKNLVTDEIIELNITSKEIDYVDGSSSNTGTFLDFGGDSYFETGRYQFADQSNCYQGSLTIEARSNEKFEFTMFLNGCFAEYLTTFSFDYIEFEHNSEVSTINVNGVEYPEAYTLNSFNNTALDNTLFYTKENGIIQILDDSSESTIFTIAD